MRFQICEMVDSPDAEMVSRALEMCLRTQWGDVAREGSTIVLRGLGPTHRVNRNDRAVFEVKPADDGRTAIEADVTYLASALVGNTAPQNELVQRKLDGVLELLRMDVDLAKRRAAQERERALKPRLVNKTSAPVVTETGIEAARVVNSAAGSTAERDLADDAAAWAVLWEKASQEEARATRSSVTHEVAVAAPPVEASTAAPASVARGVKTEPASVSPEAPAPAAKTKSGEQKLVHRGAEQTDERDKQSRLAKERSTVKIFLGLLAFFVLVGVGQEAWLHRAQLSQRITGWRYQWSGSDSGDASGAAVLTPEQKAAEQLAAREAAAADAESAAEAAKLAEPDPKKWLANWAEALRGQDAGAQAAFYADTVEKYFLRKDMSRAEVMAARQDAIAKKNGTWSLELDDVVVAQQTDATARVLMVKHIVMETGNGKVEQRLPTQIRLKRINGEWRIVSEQTLG